MSKSEEEQKRTLIEREVEPAPQQEAAPKEEGLGSKIFRFFMPKFIADFVLGPKPEKVEPVVDLDIRDVVTGPYQTISEVKKFGIEQYAPNSKDPNLDPKSKEAKLEIDEYALEQGRRALKPLASKDVLEEANNIAKPFNDAVKGKSSEQGSPPTPTQKSASQERF